MEKDTENYTCSRTRQKPSGEQCVECGNCTEETQHDPAPVPPGIGDKEHTERKVNEQIQWNKEEMKEVVWCFRHVKETTCTENYKLAYDLWKQRNRNSRRNMDAKLLLKQRNYILKNKKNYRS
jgi:hypothetical protein